MADIPGNAGVSVLGDKTVEIYKDAMNFINRSVDQYKSRIFLTRLLIKPTVILASNNATYELLNSKYENFEIGYKDFVYNFYGDNVLFMNDKDALETRSFIHPFFCQDRKRRNFDKALKFISQWTNALPAREPVPVYGSFKQMAKHLCIILFFGIESPDVIDEIISLTSGHGVISFPKNSKVSSFMPSDKKVITDKEKLLSIIKKHVSLEHLQLPDEKLHLLIQHLFMAVSFLIPKAIASFLTSFVISSKYWMRDYTNKQGNLLKEELDNLLLEIQRCWPPFVGGRRITTKDCQLQGYHIPSSYAVFYVNFAVHRDPEIFPNPDTFWPERWKTCNISHRDRIFSFGGGPRNCIASYLMEDVVKEFCIILMENCYWEPIKFSDSDLKWIPVTRPKQDPIIQFISKYPK